MHDLVKITSRKTQTKVITFYFRIPTYPEYAQSEEKLQEANAELFTATKPRSDYEFAYKRANFEDVSMSFMFDEEDGAKSCI